MRIPLVKHTVERVRMQLIEDVTAMATWSAEQRRAGRTIGFVPTMGALHEGHLALVRQALSTCDVVVASIFVNPLQFNNANDLLKYPRQLDRDITLLEEAGCPVLFAPQQEGIYADFKTRPYELGGLDHFLEGASRPGHFQGVVNVVERLFHYVRPDVAFFGEKDRQQLAVIRQVTQQGRWPERIVGCPTVRAADGLALSSRNARLTSEERAVAPVLFLGLCAAAKNAFRSSVEECRHEGLSVLASSPAIELDYFEITHPTTLRPLLHWGPLDEAAVLVAASIGNVRLIDNLTLRR